MNFNEKIRFNDRPLCVELVDLIRDNHLIIKKRRFHDSTAGRDGIDYLVCDFQGKYITNLSGNGFCFNRISLERSKKDIISYLIYRDMQTIDEFKKWVDNVSTEYSEGEVG